MFYVFDLVSTERFFYCAGIFATFEEAGDWRNSQYSYTSPQGLVGYEGLWFNAQVRGAVFDKVALADLGAWLQSH